MEKQARKASKKQTVHLSQRSNPHAQTNQKNCKPGLANKKSSFAPLTNIQRAQFQAVESLKDTRDLCSYTFNMFSFQCSQVRGCYPTLPSASLPPMKQGQTCVAATSTTIWPRFIKQLQIYLNVRTSSDGGHKNISHIWVFGCLCTHTNEAEPTHTDIHRHYILYA